ncbi:MAG: hypothetical protein H7Y38_14555 [Armatimonadetes bacterium]|nr:hypothetical protein [Armatimonadota bacterium]
MTRCEIAEQYEVFRNMRFPKTAYGEPGTRLAELATPLTDAYAAGCVSSYLVASTEEPVDEWKIGVLEECIPRLGDIADCLIESDDVAYFRLLQKLSEAVLEKAQAGDYD